MKRLKRKDASLLFVVLVTPIILVVGVLLGDRNYGITSTAIILLSMLPFFLSFERRKPKPRELVPIAVMAAIAAMGRLAFAALPQFKPIVAIVIITALAFGPEAGFMSGALSMLASNFFFGQGPWTPWQMFCCGIIGFLAGWLRERGLLKKRWSLCIYGFLSGYLYGLIVDVWTVSAFSDGSWKGILAIYVSGFYFNTILAVATAFFLFILAKPFEKKLLRIKVKYGLIEEID